MDAARLYVSFAVAVALMVACGGGSRSNDDASAAGASAGNAGKASADAGGSSGGSSTSGGTPSANSGGAGSSAGGTGESGSVGVEGGASGAEHGGQGGEGGEAGAPDTCEPITDEQCTYDRQMTLAPPTITDEDEDGLVEPGERIVIHSELHNPGPLDHSSYPGVTFTTSHPDLQPQSGNWHNLFAMLVGQSQPFELELELSPDAIVGSTISITLVPSGINAHPDCCGQHAITLDLLVE